MDIMSHLLEKHKNEVPYEIKNHVDSSEHCHSAQFQGGIIYVLSAKVKSFTHISKIGLLSDISEMEISVSFLNNPFISLLDSSTNTCDFSLDPYLSSSNPSSLHSNGYNYDLEECL